MTFHATEVLFNHRGIQRGEAVGLGLRADAELTRYPLYAWVILDQRLVAVLLVNALSMRPKHLLFDRAKRSPVSHHPKQSEFQTSVPRIVVLGRVWWRANDGREGPSITLRQRFVAFASIPFKQGYRCLR